MKRNALRLSGYATSAARILAVTRATTPHGNGVVAEEIVTDNFRQERTSRVLNLAAGMALASTATWTCLMSGGGDGYIRRVCRRRCWLTSGETIDGGLKLFCRAIDKFLQRVKTRPAVIPDVQQQGGVALTFEAVSLSHIDVSRPAMFMKVEGRPISHL